MTTLAKDQEFFLAWIHRTFGSDYFAKKSFSSSLYWECWKSALSYSKKYYKSVAPCEDYTGVGHYLSCMDPNCELAYCVDRRNSQGKIKYPEERIDIGKNGKLSPNAQWYNKIISDMKKLNGDQ